MSIGREPSEEELRAYQQMEEQKNMANQPQREGELPPVLAPENAEKKAGGLNDLEKKLAAGEMTPQEAETYANQILNTSPDLLAQLDEIDQLSLPTADQINLGLGTEKDQERATQARHALIDQATARAVTFFVKEAGKGAYKDTPPENFVQEVRNRLHETMDKALAPIRAEARKSYERRARGEKATNRQAA